MKNISDTEAYTVYDFVFSKAARTLSNFIGVKRITRPFWDRWRASGIDDATIFRVLDGIATIDNWATVAGRVVDEEIAAFAQVRPGLVAQGDGLHGARLSDLLSERAALPRHASAARDRGGAGDRLQSLDRRARAAA